MDDEMIIEQFIDTRQRLEAHRAILMTLVDSLTKQGLLDRADLIGDLAGLEQAGRQRNEAAATIQEIQLLIESLHYV